MDHIYTYNKTYQDRLQEFVNILGGSKSLSISEIKKEWSFYLELAMDPNGWQAIWKIPRLVCEELDVDYPTMVLVYVDSVDFVELTASIRVLAVQYDITLPNKYIVPLIQLSITKVQDNSVGLNLESTANCLDMLRFFYTHILMPWDYADDTSDWLSKHLQQRLRLFYNMNNGTISKCTTEQLKCLLTKARRLNAYRDQLESKIEEHENEFEVNKLLDIHVSLALIRGEVEILGNNVFQDVYLQSLSEAHPEKSANSKPIYWVIFEQNDTIDDQITFLNKAKEIIGNGTIRPVFKLAQVLQLVKEGDCILFNRGTHEINETACLPNDVSIRGVYPEEETVLLSTNDDILLYCVGNLVLVNVTLDVKTVQCGILAHTGIVTLQNCKVKGDGKSSIHQGIIVLAGSKLEMKNCDISDFYTTIVGNSSSAVTLQNCNISGANQGIKIFDNCNLDAQGVLFTNCKDYGIYAETEKFLEDGVFQVGNFSVLEMFPDVKLENVSGENNEKGDAIIVHKAKLKAITELFSNPDLDPTIIHDESDDEMNMNISTSNGNQSRK